ncbi:TonB-dependent receptor [Xanthomonadaceae bacterium JHOS43]|nr:TonB-dependent receptor [Xanthomonadaceae bacterium JHOS43]
MKLKRAKLREAIVSSLALGAMSLAASGMVFAQEEESAEIRLDAVTVTGTRIKSQTMTESAPITEISPEEFKYYGATTVEDLVNQYPQVDLYFDNFQNNPSYGHSVVSLRSLGPARTLTLVNGRRLPSSRNELADTSIVPPALIKRVDILTGGASAIYGADAVAGVVNFMLDDKFEGISLTYGYSAYQHNNDNKEMQRLNDEAGYEAPTGSSGFDGISRNADLIVGGSFAGDRGHAVGWVTWRENDALYHGQRDYTHCSVWYDEPVCGGSGTADPGRFTVAEVGGANLGNFIYNGSGYEPGVHLYNYAPVNFFQRPDKRITAGFTASYEINDHFTPYVEAMFLERRSEMQIAESGAFGVPITVNCNNPLIGTLCADAGVTTEQTRITMWKRNVEGGPRHHGSDDSTYRLTAGVKGAILDASTWTYDISASSGRYKTTDIGTNDFLISRIAAAATGCTDPVYGSFGGCQLWDIWNDNITAEAAAAMAGTSFAIYKNSYTALSAVASGELGFGFPGADGERIGLAVGAERRSYSYSSVYDTDSSAGNFAGAGAADLPVNADNSVTDLFFEAGLPIYVGNGAMNRFDASLGYRYSDDDTSGSNDTYKLGLSALFWDSKLLLRAGYNRAVRSPSLNDMYYPQRIVLGGTRDFCAGPNPEFTAEQCARTGLPTSAYGNVPASPANQYNALTGGNPDLLPEIADTYTVGFAIEPIKDLTLALDWYSIKIEDAIGGIGYNNIQLLCMEQGLYCDRIQRDGRFGDYDLWIGLAADPGTGHIRNLAGNIGVDEREGLDFSAGYTWDLGPGRLSTTFVGNYVLSEYTMALASDPSTGYECKGLVNDTQGCQTPKWRHIAQARYSWDRYALGLRWRHIGGVDYKDADGSQLTDVIWLGTGVSSYNYLDLNGSVSVGPATVSLGINNIFDKEPPFVGDADGGFGSHANSLGGYDQAGRYIFGSINVNF